MKGKGNGEVEGVVGRFEDNDLLVPARIRWWSGSRTKESRETYLANENLLRSTWSSGAVTMSISCPICVWNVVSWNTSRR